MDRKRGEWVRLELRYAGEARPRLDGGRLLVYELVSNDVASTSCRFWRRPSVVDTPLPALDLGLREYVTAKAWSEYVGSIIEEDCVYMVGGDGRED